MIIEQPTKWLRWLYPSAIWRMNPTEKAVYLTFDDGPIPESTPWLIETLDRYGVKATFFMVGDNVRKYPHLFELFSLLHWSNLIFGTKIQQKNYIIG